MKEAFYTEYANWIPHGVCEDHQAEFVASLGSFTNQCDKCCEAAKYDKRTPGLFKTEYEVDGIIYLC